MTSHMENDAWGADPDDRVEDPEDRASRLLSLRADGRLDDAGTRELDALLAADGEARAFERDLDRLRDALRVDADAANTPATPAGLLDRTLARVAAERRRQGDQGRVLVLSRGLALAAAAILMTTLFAFFRTDRQVGADPVDRQPTVEDRLEGGLREFLEERFLGRDAAADRSDAGDQVQSEGSAGR